MNIEQAIKNRLSDGGSMRQGMQIGGGMNQADGQLGQSYPQPPTMDSPVYAQLSDLKCAINEAHEMLSMIIDKLAPVRRLDETKACGLGSPEPMACCTLVGDLQAKTANARQLALRLQTLNDELQIW